MIVRSALFNILFWLSILVVGIIALPFEIAWRPFSRTVARAWVGGILWLLRVLCGITHEVRGSQYIPQGAALIASKHQSAWDTFIFWALVKKPVFVLKRELVYLPVFGWQLLLLGSISIDRRAGAGAMKRMLRQARDRVQEGGAVIIFPEGTRTAVGASGTYHPGVAALYQQLDGPVTPVALNSGLCWSRNAFVKKPGVITIEFLPPIPPGMRGRDLLPLLKERIEAASAALLPHSGDFE